MRETTHAIFLIWMRYFDVYRKNIFYSFLTTFLEPLLYLLSFGYGVYAIVGDISSGGKEISYRSFIFSGILGQSLLFQSFFESAYGGFIRMYYQKIFKAMATTPITLSEVLWGELIWSATKGTLASFSVLIIGLLFGIFQLKGILISIPICFFGSLLFAAFGLWMAALSKTIEHISYPQFLVVFPMFLFSGVYFPLEKMPEAVQIGAYVLPLTSLLSLFRTIHLGLPFEIKAIFILVAWIIFLIPVSRWAMTKRLIN